VKHLPIIAAAIFLAVAPAAHAGERVTQKLDLKNFSAIDVGGAFELDVTVGKDFSVALSGSPEEMARVEAFVSKSSLVLDSKKRQRNHKRTKSGVHAVISMPRLDRLDVSGVADADISGVDAGAFRIHLSGVGEVNVAGACSDLDARVSGVGELDAQRLECKNADVRVSGIGEANFFASEHARAEVSGMGEINIYGSPKNVEKRGGFMAEIRVHN